MTSISITRPAISAVSVFALSSYNKSAYSGNTLKRSGYQLVASLGANTLEGFIRPLLPPSAQLSTMYMRPIVVGGAFTILAKFIDGDKSYVMNFLLSGGSELLAGYLESPFQSALSPSSSVLSPVLATNRSAF